MIDVPYRVLVVDDEAVVRAVVVDILESLGYDARAAEAPGLAPLLAGWAPDAALVDLAMPGTDGLAVTAYLRRQFPKLRIVLYSAQEPLAGGNAFARFAGADAWIGKPFTIDDLAASVRPAGD